MTHAINAVWQIQEAKNRFSEMIACALTQGPQILTRHGRAVIRVVAVNPSAALETPSNDGFTQYLLSAPKIEASDGLEIPPRRSRAHALMLGG